MKMNIWLALHVCFETYESGDFCGVEVWENRAVLRALAMLQSGVQKKTSNAVTSSFEIGRPLASDFHLPISNSPFKDCA